MESRSTISEVQTSSRWLSSTLSAAALRAWRWFLPADYPTEQSEQAQRVLAYFLGMCVWVTASAVAYHLLGVPVAVAMLLVAALSLVGIALLFRHCRCPMLCGNLLVALSLGVYAALALVTGGPAAPVTPWFVATPIIAMLVTGTRWGMLWTILAALTASGLFAAREMGVDFPAPFSASTLRVLQWGGLIRLVVFIAALALLYKFIEFRQRAALKAAMLAAQAAARVKSEFLANMSHEIRTPLTAILGYTELLRENRGKPLEATRICRTDALDTIHRNGEHLLQVINDILDFSKIEAGRLEIESSFASPRQIAADVLELFAARAAAKDLQLQSCCEPQLPPAIETDPTRLRQVLANLVGNAVKFTQTGSVRVDARWVGLQSGAGRIEFAIRDTGIGMSPGELKKLFQPFSQADGSTSRRYGGTGLGLAISRRLVQMMGGTIEAASEPEQGSCFTVSLPIARAKFRSAADIEAVSDDKAAPSQAMVSGNEQEACLAGCRILLAEDSPDNQRLIRHLLEGVGADVSLAENGESAVELALEDRSQGAAFDLILMDMQMPRQNGYEATSRLRAAGFQQPIIALTAHALAAEHDNCLAAGCNEVCTKPIERSEFFALIRQCVNGSKAAPSVAESSAATP